MATESDYKALLEPVKALMDLYQVQVDAQELLRVIESTIVKNRLATLLQAGILTEEEIGTKFVGDLERLIMVRDLTVDSAEAEWVTMFANGLNGDIYQAVIAALFQTLRARS